MAKVVTFGCRINSYESEIFKEKLKAYDNKTVTIVTDEGVESAFEKSDIALIRQALDF